MNTSKERVFEIIHAISRLFFILEFVYYNFCKLQLPRYVSLSIRTHLRKNNKYRKNYFSKKFQTFFEFVMELAMCTQHNAPISIIFVLCRNAKGCFAIRIQILLCFYSSMKTHFTFQILKDANYINVTSIEIGFFDKIKKMKISDEIILLMF